MTHLEPTELGRSQLAWLLFVVCFLKNLVDTIFTLHCCMMCTFDFFKLTFLFSYNCRISREFQYIVTPNGNCKHIAKLQFSVTVQYRYWHWYSQDTRHFYHTITNVDFYSHIYFLPIHTFLSPEKHSSVLHFYNCDFSRMLCK